MWIVYYDKHMDLRVLIHEKGMFLTRYSVRANCTLQVIHKKKKKNFPIDTPRQIFSSCYCMQLNN